MLIVSYAKFEPSRYLCRKCKARLEAIPERLMGEWAVRCYSCASLNIIEYKIEIVGYKTDEQW